MSYPLPPKKEEEFKSRQKGGRSEWIGKKADTRDTRRKEREKYKEEGGRE